MKKALKNETGAVLIVEASFIFPIMFLVILLMYFLGNAFYQRSRVDNIAAEMAFYGSAQCADPLLKKVQEDEKVPGYSYKYEIQPYRYLLGEAGSGAGMNEIEKDVESQIRNKINALGTGFFSKMEPKIISLNAEFNNMFVYSTFIVEVNYEVPLPIRLLGMEKNFTMPSSALCEVPVSDTPEFMRNVDMVGDWLEASPTAQKALEKVDEVMTKFEELVN